MSKPQGQRKFSFPGMNVSELRVLWRQSSAPSSLLNNACSVSQSALALAARAALTASA